MERTDCGLIELKFEGSPSTTMSFQGYGATFSKVDSYGDVIARGAFANTLKEAKESGIWPKMLSQHGGLGLTSEDMTPVGVWADLSEDPKGLLVDGVLANTARGVDLHTLMKMKPRPAIDSLSIGYKTIRSKARVASTDPRRTLEEIKLLEVSPVTFPANSDARVASVKCDVNGIMSLQDAEAALREAGFTKSDAIAFVSHIKQLGRSDSVLGDRSDSVSAELVRALQSRSIKA